MANLLMRKRQRSFQPSDTGENSRGLTEIASKEARNQRGIPGSPDRAESLIMAFMRIVPQETIVNLENFTAKGYEISPY